MTDNKIFDVIVVGGSFSGLSAALALGRSLRHVLVIDSGLPCNRQTPHSHNFITHDGQKPSLIAQKAKEDVLKYETVKFHNGLAVSGTTTEAGFAITTEDGELFYSKKLIFATGIKDTMPKIKGFEACWGISMVHCPYCHGYELRGKKTGLMANGPRALHMATLVRNLTDKLSILSQGKADFTPEEIAKLKNQNIEIIETEIVEIIHSHGQVKDVLFVDGSKMAFEGIYAALPFTQHCSIPAALGCEITEMGYIKVDNFQKTNIEGVFACGDNSTMMRAVAGAVSTGNMAGAMANGELSAAQF
jgi:thioredoxin reductase